LNSARVSGGTERLPSVLIALRVSMVAGAERLVLEEVPGLSKDFAVDLTVLTVPGDGGRRLGHLPLVDVRELGWGGHDLIHTHLFLPGFLVRLRRMWGGSFRWVHSVHYCRYDTLSFPWLRRHLDAWVFREADKVIAVSPDIMETIRELPGAVFLENAIHLSPVVAPPSECDPPLIGTVAMLRPEKGLADLIRAAAVLRDRKVDVRFLIAGEGPLRAELESLIDELKLRGLVKLCGFVTILDQFYRDLSVYVQPSVSESFGLATLEALRFRRPVVGTATGHLPVVLDHGRFGLLVERNGDVATALADGIVQALEMREELAERAEQGRQHWAEHLDPARRMQRGKEIYRDALKPRVCFVTPIATQGGGGVPRQVRIQSEALSAAGHRTLLVQRRDPRLVDDERHRLGWRHLEVVETPDPFSGGGRSGGFVRLRGAAFVVLALIRLIGARTRFDIIHAQQLYSPTLIGALAKRFLGKRLVVRVTASGELGEARELGRLPFRGIREWAFRQVDRVVVLSETMKEEVLRLGFDRGRVVVIPNAVQLPPEPVAPHSGSGEPFRMLYTGRLSTEKSLETILEAAELLAQRGIATEVRLVGGPAVERDATAVLRAMAEDLSDDVTVLFGGHVDDVSAEYADADVFVLPSVSEGMSNSLLEAMAHGMVCLVSDIPENRAVLGEGGTGLLFRQGCAEELAAHVSDLINDEASGGKKMAVLRHRARARVEVEFSPERIASELAALYDEILSD
jgi:L-malate glycosyltransferase